MLNDCFYTSRVERSRVLARDGKRLSHAGRRREAGTLVVVKGNPMLGRRRIMKAVSVHSKSSGKGFTEETGRQAYRSR